MHELLQNHLRGLIRLLEAYYEISHTAGTPTLLGDLRERFIREILTFFLPSTYDISTGEITDYRNERSNQQDIVIYKRAFPKLQVIDGPAIFFAEGVKATIEVKSTLTYDMFSQACDNVSSVVNLKPKVKKFAVGEKSDYIFKYIFAYRGPAQDETVIEWYNRYKREKNWTDEEFYTNIPDVLYYINGSLFYKNDGYVFAKNENPDGSPVYYCKSEHPIAIDKFFMHLAIVLSYPDIINIDWAHYLSDN